MKKGFLSDYFTGVVAKRLSTVETSPKTSNQHEFNGVKQLKLLLGEAKQTNIRCRFIWIEEENEGISEEGFVSWYDSRENHATRSEHRLYFSSNDVLKIASEGDIIFFARQPDKSLVAIVTPAEGTILNQLVWLFDIQEEIGSGFTYQLVSDSDNAKSEYVIRYILEELGIEVNEPEEVILDNILKDFNGKLPDTRTFSKCARDTIGIDLSAREMPDQTLLEWINWEEKLFRRMERHLVSERLQVGFVDRSEVDVNGFIRFSLSVQNRRKSRVGHALENHLEEIFKQNNLRFDRGKMTESRKKPDFLFPGTTEYQNEEFSASYLTMLGAKTTCKDRWRQVLTEANRINKKHLLTLEPSITENQTDEMKSVNLQLVLPTALHNTYSVPQQSWLMNLNDFIQMTTEKQKYFS